MLVAQQQWPAGLLPNTGAVVGVVQGLHRQAPSAVPGQLAGTECRGELWTGQVHLCTSTCVPVGTSRRGPSVACGRFGQGRFSPLSQRQQRQKENERERERERSVLRLRQLSCQFEHVGLPRAGKWAHTAIARRQGIRALAACGMDLGHAAALVADLYNSTATGYAAVQSPRDLWPVVLLPDEHGITLHLRHPLFVRWRLASQSDGPADRGI